MSSSSTSAVRHLPLLPVAANDEEPEGRPRTRADCCNGPRPCPWVSCRHHLGIEVSLVGAGRRSIHLNGEAGDTYLARYSHAHFVDWSDEAVDQIGAMRETCSLDVAEQGGKTLEEIGELLGLTRERIRQIERSALMRLRNKAGLEELAREVEEP